MVAQKVVGDWPELPWGGALRRDLTAEDQHAASVLPRTHASLTPRRLVPDTRAPENSPIQR